MDVYKYISQSVCSFKSVNHDLKALSKTQIIVLSNKPSNKLTQSVD